MLRKEATKKAEEEAELAVAEKKKKAEMKLAKARQEGQEDGAPGATPATAGNEQEQASSLMKRRQSAAPGSPNALFL